MGRGSCRHLAGGDQRFPDLRLWVAHNKTVSLEVLEVLRYDADEKAQSMVRLKRSWAREHPEDSTRAAGRKDTRSKAWKSTPLRVEDH